VNRKVLVIFVAMMAVAMLATPLIGTVTAGKGQEKLSIRLDVGSYDTTTGTSDRTWNSPVKIPYPDYISRVLHSRGGDWGDPATHAGFAIVVDEDIECDNDEILYSCSYDDNAINKAYGQEALPYVVMTIKVNERWEIDNGDYVGYIEVSTAEKVYDYLGLYAGFHVEGSFVGHGVINGQSVNLSGETGYDTGIFREGTVMGWPT